MTPAQTKERIVALLLVFAVVIFFWMAFHQNGLTMTFFARDYTTQSVTGIDRIGFDVWNLVLVIIAVYGAFSLFQSKIWSWKSNCWCCCIGFPWYISVELLLYDSTVEIFLKYSSSLIQFFVVALTPVSLAAFWLFG